MMQVPDLLSRVWQHGGPAKTPILRPRFPHPLRRLLATGARHLPCLPHCTHRIQPQTRNPKPPNHILQSLPVRSKLRHRRNLSRYTSMGSSEPPPAIAALYPPPLFPPNPPNPRNPKLFRIQECRCRASTAGKSRFIW